MRRGIGRRLAPRRARPVISSAALGSLGGHGDVQCPAVAAASLFADVCGRAPEADAAADVAETLRAGLAAASPSTEGRVLSTSGADLLHLFRTWHGATTVGLPKSVAAAVVRDVCSERAPDPATLRRALDALSMAEPDDAAFTRALLPLLRSAPLPHVPLLAEAVLRRTADPKAMHEALRLTAVAARDRADRSSIRCTIDAAAAAVPRALLQDRPAQAQQQLIISASIVAHSAPWPCALAFFRCVMAAFASAPPDSHAVQTTAACRFVNAVAHRLEQQGSPRLGPAGPSYPTSSSGAGDDAELAVLVLDAVDRILGPAHAAAVPLPRNGEVAESLGHAVFALAALGENHPALATSACRQGLVDFEEGGAMPPAGSSLESAARFWDSQSRGGPRPCAHFSTVTALSALGLVEEALAAALAVATSRKAQGGWVGVPRAVLQAEQHAAEAAGRAAAAGKLDPSWCVQRLLDIADGFGGPVAPDSLISAMCAGAAAGLCHSPSDSAARRLAEAIAAAPAVPIDSLTALGHGLVSHLGSDAAAASVIALSGAFPKAQLGASCVAWAVHIGRHTTALQLCALAPAGVLHTEEHPGLAVSPVVVSSLRHSAKAAAHPIDGVLSSVAEGRPIAWTAWGCARCCTANGLADTTCRGCGESYGPEAAVLRLPPVWVCGHCSAEHRLSESSAAAGLCCPSCLAPRCPEQLLGPAEDSCTLTPHDVLASVTATLRLVTHSPARSVAALSALLGPTTRLLGAVSAARMTATSSFVATPLLDLLDRALLSAAAATALSHGSLGSAQKRSLLALGTRLGALAGCAAGGGLEGRCRHCLGSHSEAFCPLLAAQGGAPWVCNVCTAVNCRGPKSGEEARAAALDPKALCPAETEEYREAVAKAAAPAHPPTVGFDLTATLTDTPAAEADEDSALHATGLGAVAAAFRHALATATPERVGVSLYCCHECLEVREEYMELPRWDETRECPQCKRLTPAMEDQCSYCDHVRPEAASESEEAEDTLPFFPAKCGLCGELHLEALCPLCSAGARTRREIRHGRGVVCRVTPHYAFVQPWGTITRAHQVYVPKELLQLPVTSGQWDALHHAHHGGCDFGVVHSGIEGGLETAARVGDGVLFDASLSIDTGKLRATSLKFDCR